MQILVLFLMSFCFSFSVFANFVAKSKIKTPTKIYTTQSRCEVSESEKCFDMSLKDMRRWDLGFRAVDVNDTVDCTDSANCLAIKNSTFGCGGADETPSFDNKSNWPALDFTKATLPRLNTGWFLWCEKEILVNDSAGSTQADSDDAAAATEKSNRAAKKSQRLVDKNACVSAVNGIPALIPDQIKDCLNTLIKQVYQNEIADSDL